MEQIRVALDDRLANVGDTVPFKGHIDISEFVLGERPFALPEGMEYDVMLTNAGEGILVTGLVSAHAVASCDRCLDEAHMDVRGGVDEYYLFHEPEQGVLDEQEEEEGPDFSLVGEDSTIDLTDALSAAFAMEIPYVVLCREDCAGLCPVCGENLNHVDCGHAEMIAAEAEEERMARSPFAALKDLKLDE